MASYADSRYGLRGYRCLVTGGSKGIGAAVVEELSSLGATVSGISHPLPPMQHETASQIEAGPTGLHMR